MFGQIVHRDFSNIGFSGQGRAFPGFVPNDTCRKQVFARDAVRFDLKADDLLCLPQTNSTADLWLAVFDTSGRPSPTHLGLKKAQSLPLTSFDSDSFAGWAKANGGTTAATIKAVHIPLEEPLILKAKGRATVWAIAPQTAPDLVQKSASQPLEIELKSANTDARALPPYLGEIRDEFTVSRGTARAYELAPGEVVQIIDIEGQQCSDFTALRSAALESGHEIAIDSTATRSMVRGAYPQPGLLDKFFDPEMRPMLRMVQDTCGRHDTFGLACTARGYEERGFPGHVNCSDNISNALDPFGVARRAAWPAINFFWNTWITHPGNQLSSEESHSRPGDYVAMRAIDRLVCVSTACPDDIDPINGWNPTDVHIRIYKPDAPIRRAVAYREKEDAPMKISEESAFHPRTAPLTTHFAPARDLWAPVSFPGTGTLGEYWACREKVTLQDMSGLRKIGRAHV